MASATLGLINHTEIDDADATTSWAGALDTLDPDIKKEGTNSMTGVFRANGDNGYYDDGTARSSSGEHLRMWVNTINAPYMQPESSNGYQVFVNDGTNTDYYVIFGSDTYPGGWFNVVVDCALFTTVTAANVRRWGLYANHTSNAKNADNTWVDYVRYMDGYYITGGTSGDKVRLSDVAVADKGTTTLFGYGIVEEYEGNYFASGEIQLGNGTTTTFFEMDGDVLTYTDKPVANGLYKLNGNGSGADILITNSTIKASGTGDDNRPDVDMSTDSPGTVSITDTVFIRGGTFLLGSGQDWTGCTFNDCQQITANGADLTGSTIQNYEGTAGTGAILYNVSGDPDGELDLITFEKGTASTHAIQFGTTAPTTMTLRGMTFTGYNASDQQTDSVLYFPDKGTDTTWTVNVVGCTGTVSVYKARSGDTVNLVIDPKSLTITVNDPDGNPYQGARVLAEPTSAANFPYNATVSITGSGTTATVTHTAHGLETNDYVIIKGVTNDDDYNGVYQITVTGVNTYTYTASGTLDVTPAVGTITSTYAMISDTTDVNGEVTNSWSLSANQPFLYKVGVSRTTSPFYKGVEDRADTIETTADRDITVQLVSDE